jgi:maleylacetate reductase
VLAQAARDRAIACRADAVLAVGGGAAIGLAKAVALTSGVPIAAAPTTYAGSEMTPVWALSQPSGRISGTDWRVLPRLVIYDPRLQLSLRARTSAASGVTALAHAVEALWAPAANAVSSAVAEDALRALAGGLERVVAVPEDLAIRTTMLRGAWLAGMAMAGAGAAIHHQLCDLIVSAFRLPYAEVHAAVLPHVAATVAPEAPAAMVRIARALRVEHPVGELQRLIAALELPRGLRDLGLTDGHLPAATELALGAGLASPRRLTEDDVRRLVRRIFDGAP